MTTGSAISNAPRTIGSGGHPNLVTGESVVPESPRVAVEALVNRVRRRVRESPPYLQLEGARVLAILEQEAGKL